jgi:hypothetical protein
MSGTQAFEVRNPVFVSGERFSALIDGDTGVPDFEVTLYILTQLRTRNLFASTLTAATLNSSEYRLPLIRSPWVEYYGSGVSTIVMAIQSAKILWKA